MKGRVVVLGVCRGREAAALVVDGQLQDLLVDAGEAAGLAPGAILRGRARPADEGPGGAFREAAGRRGSGLPSARDEGAGARQAGHRPGRGLCQPGKALPLTARVLFKSRLCIVTPAAPGLNISRRIREEDARDRLGTLAAAGMEGCGFGLILRSAAEAAEDETAADIAATRGLAEAVMADTAGGPELCCAAPGPHEEAWRDWSDPARRSGRGEGAFARHGVEEMVDALLSPLVPLPGGGHMAIEPTRALVAVDVNTGADTSPAASLKANIAAARDLPRQLPAEGARRPGDGGFRADAEAPTRRARPAARLAFKGEAAETSLQAGRRSATWSPLSLILREARG